MVFLLKANASFSLFFQQLQGWPDREMEYKNRYMYHFERCSWYKSSSSDSTHTSLAGADKSIRTTSPAIAFVAPHYTLPVSLSVKRVKDHDFHS